MIDKKVNLKVLISYVFFLLLSVSIFSDFFQTNLLQAQEIDRDAYHQNIEKDPAVTCLENGQELFWQQEYDKAIKQLKNCQELDPDNPEIYFYLGQSYFQKGQLSAQKNNPIKAYRYYQDAFEISEITIKKYYKQIEKYPDEDHTSQYLRLAYIYQIRSLIPGVEEYQEALDIYQRLLDEKPYLVSAHYHMGWIYFQKEKYSDAIHSFLEYLKPGMKSDFVYYHLGLSYDKIGEKQKAEYYYQLILEEFPDTDLARRAKKELN